MGAVVTSDEGTVTIYGSGGSVTATEATQKVDVSEAPDTVTARGAPETVEVVSGVSDHPTYEGSYEVTPSTSAQTIDTASKVMARNLVVNPIPSNYGLITWDGTKLTVS